MKKVLVYILMLISVVFISGCGDSFTKKEQDDFKEEIMNELKVDKLFQGTGVFVTLDSSFVEYESDVWDMYLYNGEFAFMSQRISKQSNLNGMSYSQLTLKQYFQLVMTTNNFESYIYEEKTIYGDDLLYCYIKTRDANAELDYGYMMMVMESDSFFYTMNLSCDHEQLDTNKALFERYGKSISVK